MSKLKNIFVKDNKIFVVFLDLFLSPPRHSMAQGERSGTIPASLLKMEGPMWNLLKAF